MPNVNSSNNNSEHRYEMSVNGGVTFRANRIIYDDRTEYIVEDFLCCEPLCSFGHGFFWDGTADDLAALFPLIIWLTNNVDFSICLSRVDGTDEYIELNHLLENGEVINEKVIRDNTGERREPIVLPEYRNRQNNNC